MVRLCHPSLHVYQVAEPRRYEAESPNSTARSRPPRTVALGQLASIRKFIVKGRGGVAVVVHPFHVACSWDI